MNPKYNVVLAIFAVACSLFAIVGDSFLHRQGLGTVIGSAVMLCAIFTCIVLTALSNRRDAAAAKRDAEVRAMLRQESKTPVFAHVPGPGEPGYDPSYDPDDDKYWRRYY